MAPGTSRSNFVIVSNVLTDTRIFVYFAVRTATPQHLIFAKYYIVSGHSFLAIRFIDSFLVREIYLVHAYLLI